MIGVGATLNERFTLEKELGHGGMGTVYSATDQVLGRNVAIKLLNDSRVEGVAETLRLEAQILARLVHDKIVRLYDFGESERVCFIVMEEINGPSFANRWRDLLLDERLRICGQVAEALDYAHMQGVIHRDVKPGNILLTPADEARLSDFGLSCVTDGDTDQSGTIRGTPCYMSPEQAQGKSLDHRTDLYSVGVMLYECVTGDVPFIGHQRSVLDQHINAKPTAPRFMNPTISPTLESLILSLLEKRPTKRPDSGRDVARVLAEETVREQARRIEPTGSWEKRSDPRSPDAPSVSPSRAGIPTVSTSPQADPIAPQPSGRTTVPGTHSHPVAREMLTAMLAKPIVVSPEERYLCGHYLAYLLVGSRGRGLFQRGPLDARNSNRARLLLAMAWLANIEPSDDAIARAGTLLDDRPDIRAALSPVVVMNYLASRSSPSKRRRFRELRQRLLEASTYAQHTMVDSRGVLNPGMMPRTLDDLVSVAPPLDTLDAHRVALWNRLAEVWRRDDDFRKAVLRYATRSAHLDSLGADLWPEVVYPLIERTHRQRKFRSRHQALWDYIVGKLLHIPVPGVRLDRLMIIAVPSEVAEQFDEDLFTFIDDPEFDEEEAGPSESQEQTKARPVYVGAMIPRDEVPSDEEMPVKVTVLLSPPEPFLFSQETLAGLWEGALVAQENGGRPNLLHQTIPVGPYRLAVIPTGRGRSSVRAALQGLRLGKQIEFFTPSTSGKGSMSTKVIAVWLYQDGSVTVAHLDFQSKQRYILWHAPNAHHFDFEYLAELTHVLSNANMEIPDRLDRILSTN